MNSPERKTVRGSDSFQNGEPELQANVGESRAKFTERKPTASTLFLFALAAVSLYFCYLIVRPFLTPIFLAVMIAIVFHPIHVRLQARIRGRNAAALISTILVIVVLVVPTIGLGAVVSREARGLYQLLDQRSAQQGGWNPYAMHIVDRLLGWVGQYIGLKSLDLRGALLRWLEQVSRFLFSWGAHILSNIISFFAEAVIAFFTLFFLFREGGSLGSRVASFLPLRGDQLDRLFSGISNSIIANVYGCLAVGAAQGTLLSLAFWVLGLPSPVLWGLVTALFSLIPIMVPLRCGAPPSLS
jgi:predicted PurR-regulated permease PerM